MDDLCLFPVLLHSVVLPVTVTQSLEITIQINILWKYLRVA